MTTSSTTMAVIKLPRLAGERNPNIAKPMVMTVMASVCTPEPTEAARSIGQAGARKTSA